MKKLYFLFIPFVAAVISIAGLMNASSQKELYIDMTAVNLPAAAVTGPSMDMETADIDNDGDPDIILAREFAPNKILINNGNGVFTDGTAGRIPQFSYDSEDIGIADLDNDNDLDIVFASEDNAVHELYINNGNGFFRNANNRLPNSVANSVLFEDINNDNKPDILFGNAGQDFILINNGDTTFTNETATRLPSSSDVTQDLKLADIDMDGDKDLIAGNEDGNKIYINNGSGFFTDESSLRLPPSTVEETRKVTLTDIDNDGDLDLFFANVAFRSGRIKQDRLLINNDSGYFTDVTAENLPFDDEHTCEGIFVDIDYDNDPDLITSNIFYDRPMKVFSNDGNGVFTEVTDEVLPPGVIAEGIGVKNADLNNDGLTDLYLINRHTTQQGNLTDRLLIRKDTATVGVSYQTEVLNNFTLSQNYPNPFNPSTNIKFTVPKSSFVTIKVFDRLGKEVKALTGKVYSTGDHEVSFDGLNFASGIYFYKLTADEFSVTRRMVLLK